MNARVPHDPPASHDSIRPALVPPPASRRAARVLLAIAVAFGGVPAAVAGGRDTSVFVEAGRGDVSVTSTTIGATTSLLPPSASGPWDVYGEASLGRWLVHPDDASRDHHVTQVGLTPVVRYTFGAAAGGVFVEAGIGVNAITPIFASRDRRFSTTFNFGDHLGVGTRFGAAGEHELSLRLQHYSNAGIKRPNPGQDLAQLRYAYHF